MYTYIINVLVQVLSECVYMYISLFYSVLMHWCVGAEKKIILLSNINKLMLERNKLVCGGLIPTTLMQKM